MMAQRPHADGLARAEAGGISLRVRLTPKSSRDEVAGVEVTAEGEAVKARVRAVPEDGKANAALETLIAGWLGVAKGAVSVVGGARSRVKRVSVSGDAAALLARVADRLGKSG
jgi:hypothetical protein